MLRARFVRVWRWAGAVALSRDAHTSESMYGAPGFVSGVVLDVVVSDLVVLGVMTSLTVVRRARA